MNNKSPLQAYKDYLKSVKDRAQKGDMKTLAPETYLGIIAGGGILTNRFLKKKLEKMTEDVKAEVENLKLMVDVLVYLWAVHIQKVQLH